MKIEKTKKILFSRYDQAASFEKLLLLALHYCWLHATYLQTYIRTYDLNFVVALKSHWDEVGASGGSNSLIVSKCCRNECC